MRMFLSFLKKLLGGGNADLLRFLDAGAVILDVRTASEYRDGHVKGSQHIPLDQVGRELNRIRKFGKPVITCCATGRRSGMAAEILRKAGIEATNGGSWTSVRSALAASKTSG